MEYRRIKRVGIDIGVVGLGAEHLEYAPSYEAVRDVVDAAIEGGMNYMDLFMAAPVVRDNIGRALKGRRDKMMVQGHLGAVSYNSEPTVITRDKKTALEAFDDLLTRLGTDYIDTCALFFVDKDDDLDEMMAPGGLMEVALDLKKAGKARMIGMSSHLASVATKAVNTDTLDVLMFPVNPAFDRLDGIDNIDDLWTPETYDKRRGAGHSADREGLYRACAAHGTAIVSMKTYGGGWLLKENNMSGMTLTPAQCIHYALTRPAVASALIGCFNAADVAAALSYLTATVGERDFSHIHAVDKWDMRGVCMYCNHCMPCPVSIDVAALTRALDLFPDSPDTARAQYAELKVKAGECTACEGCNERCPFGVDAAGNMERAAQVFGV